AGSGAGVAGRVLGEKGRPGVSRAVVEIADDFGVEGEVARVDAAVQVDAGQPGELFLGGAAEALRDDQRLGLRHAGGGDGGAKSGDGQAHGNAPLGKAGPALSRSMTGAASPGNRPSTLIAARVRRGCRSTAATKRHVSCRPVPTRRRSAAQ